MAAEGSAETFSALPRTEGAAHTQLSQQTKRHSALKALPSSPAALRSAHADSLSVLCGRSRAVSVNAVH